ncbi:hypothetical protein BD413DRAFT_183661 [Trametes elegans]|nr:hypothetical protein BD413DRAFT_183661 [Trametes elegans]
MRRALHLSSRGCSSVACCGSLSNRTERVYSMSKAGVFTPLMDLTQGTRFRGYRRSPLSHRRKVNNGFQVMTDICSDYVTIITIDSRLIETSRHDFTECRTERDKITSVFPLQQRLSTTDASPANTSRGDFARRRVKLVTPQSAPCLLQPSLSTSTSPPCTALELTGALQRRGPLHTGWMKRTLVWL